MRVGLEHHPGQPRVDRQPREPAAERGQPLARVRGVGSSAPSSSQQLDAVGDLARGPAGRRTGRRRRRRGPSAVICRMTEARLVRRISGSVNSGRARESSSEYSRMQMPSADPAAAARALVGRRLRDRLDRQPLHLEPVAVAGDPRRARVDHVPDAGHGQRGLGDVGGQHDPPPGVRREHPVLLGGRQPGVQRQDLGRSPGSCSPASASAVSRISRSPERKTRMSPGPPRPQLLDRVADRLDLVARDVVRPVRRRRRSRPSRAGGSGSRPGRSARRPRRPGASRPKCAANRSRVDRRRGDDDLEVGAARQQLLEVAEDEVDVEAALVRLVDDDRVVARAAAGRAGSRPAGCRRSSP